MFIPVSSATTCSNIGMSPIRCQAIILATGDILLIGPLEISFRDISIEIQHFSHKKTNLKMPST